MPTTANWPDSKVFWNDKRVIVTGGAGFLGSFVVEKLRERGAAEIIVLRSSQYDLRDINAIRKLFHDVGSKSKIIVIHLAARVGGVGANRAHPAEFFYDNPSMELRTRVRAGLMMSVPLFRESWRFGVEKFVAIGTVCAYPKYTPVPFKEEDLWNGYPEETNAPYGLVKKMLGSLRQSSGQATSSPQGWCSPRPTVSSMASIRSFSCQSTSTALGISSTWSRLM